MFSELITGETPRGRPLGVLRHDDAVTSIAFHPNGQVIATSGDDNTVRLWSDQDRSVAAFLDHSSAVSTVIFSPDGADVLTGSNDGIARRWDTQTGELLTEQRIPNANEITSIEVSPDGTNVAVMSNDGMTFIYDSNLTTLLFTIGLGGTNNAGAGTDLSGDGGVDEGATDLSGDDEGATDLSGERGVDDDSGRSGRGVEDDPNARSGFGVETDPGPELVVGAPSDRDNPDTGGTIPDAGSSPGSVDGGPDTGGAGAPDNAPTGGAPDEAPVGAPDDGGDSSAIVGTSSNNTFAQRAIRSNYPSSAISPDGQILARTQPGRGDILLWNLSENRIITSIPIPNTQVRDLDFSPDMRFLTAANTNGTVQFFNVEDAFVEETRLIHASSDYLVALSCFRIWGYLTYNPSVADSDRQICQNSSNFFNESGIRAAGSLVIRQSEAERLEGFESFDSLLDVWGAPQQSPQRPNLSGLDLSIPDGATTAIVNTNDGSDAIAFTGPGLEYDLAGFVPDGTAVGLTGRREGNWYELADGNWLEGSFLVLN